jgi:hypothetical protein
MAVDSRVLDIQRNPSDQHFAAVTAPGFGRGRWLSHVGAGCTYW